VTWEQYLLKEYLAHRLYNEITDVSLNARLVRMTYPNPDKPNRSIVNYAFFTEHFKSVAKRNGAELLPRKSFDHEKLDAHSADLVALFEYMIGNTDWSIVRERNIVLLQDSNDLLQPLPFDFDMSGFFLDRQETLLSMVAEIPGLKKQSAKVANRYLERFFSTLNSSKFRQKKIVSQCQPWPPSAIDHTTPDHKR